MSRNLQHFVNNFVLGMQLGDKIQDRRSLADYRKQTLDVAKAKAIQSAEQFRATMADRAARTGGYLKDVDNRAALAAAKIAKGAGGKAGKAPLNTQQLDWAQNNGVTGVEDDATQAAPPQQITINQDAPDTGTPMPPTDADPVIAESLGGRIPAASRGGRMGQAIMTGMLTGQRSAQFAQRQNTGTNGPGSGYGTPAAAPPMALNTAPPGLQSISGAGETYRRGGAVRRYAKGGPVVDYPDDQSRPLSKWDRDRAIFEAGQAVGRTAPVDDREETYRAAEQSGQPPAPRGPAPEPQPGGDRAPIGGRTFGGQRFGGQRFGGGPLVPPARPENEPGIWDRMFGRQPRNLNEPPAGQYPPPPAEDEAGFRARNMPQDTDAPMPQMGMPTLPQDTDAPMPAMSGPSAVAGPPAPPGAAQRAPGSAPGAAGSAPGAAGGAPGRTGGGGGSRAAINTSGGPWKALGDQTRTAAYDPQKDLYDPGNIHATAQALTGAATYAGRVFHQSGGQGQIQGQGGGQGDAPNASLAQRGRSALYSGVGAADPKLMQQIFQKVDPNNTMSMEDKMTAAVQAVHDFYTKNGDTENANKSAFEVSQFAVQLSSQHAKEALKLLQSGDVQGAQDMLIKGYNYLPDGHTASVENGHIMIKDRSGAVTQSYPASPQAFMNIAQSMASGQLGWDVIRNGANMAPPGGPPAQAAAQPAAAPAGPSQTPAAPATVPVAGPAKTIAVSPAQQALPTPNPPAAPARPSPPAVTPGAVPAAPPAARPAVSAATGAPAAKPAGETTYINPPGVPSQGDDVRPAIDTSRTTTTKTPAQLEQEFYAKNPFGAPPFMTRTSKTDRSSTTSYNDVDRVVEQKRAQVEREIAAASRQGRSIGVPEKMIAAAERNKRKTFDEWHKEQLARVKQDRVQQDKLDSEERAAGKPRDMPLNAESTVIPEMAARTDALAAEASKKWREGGAEKAAGDQASRDTANSPLRWAKTPKDKEQINKVAAGILRYNRGHTVNDAVDDAVGLSSILRPNADGTMPVGWNYNQGQKAAVFKRIGDDGNGNVVLEVPTPNGVGTRTITLDRNTYGNLVSLHQQNWKQYTEEAKTAKKSNAVDEKGRAAIKTLIPQNMFKPPEHGQVPY